MRGLVVAAITTLSVSPTFPQEAKPGVGIIGFGNTSCGSWASSKSANTVASIVMENALEGWVEGYITAMAVESDRVNAAIHRTDPAGLTAWIDNWCKANPLKSMAKAAEALSVELDR
jgi:hypothetical protein